MVPLQENSGSVEIHLIHARAITPNPTPPTRAARTTFPLFLIALISTIYVLQLFLVNSMKNQSLMAHTEVLTPKVQLYKLKNWWFFTRPR
jgi:hypothetical protein